jgi:hypothetical protein
MNTIQGRLTDMEKLAYRIADERDLANKHLVLANKYLDEVLARGDRKITALRDIGAYCGRPMDKFKGEYMAKDVEQLLRDILERVKFGLGGAPL